MRLTVIVVFLASSISTHALAQGPEEPGVVVTAEIVRAHRAGRRCELRLRILTVERGVHPELAPARIVAATTSCHPYAMHGMTRGGRFRFELRWRTGVPDARVIGGRLRDPTLYGSD